MPEGEVQDLTAGDLVERTAQERLVHQRDDVAVHLDPRRFVPVVR